MPSGKHSEIALVKRLRERGWQLTAQRRSVAEAFSGDHVHLTADEVHHLAAARLPEISRATVYKTLKELVDLGELREVRLGGRAARYDPNLDEQHRHLLCERCGLIWDVYPRGELGLTLPEEQRHGFTLSAVDVVFAGLCAPCSRAMGSGERESEKRESEKRPKKAKAKTVRPRLA